MSGIADGAKAGAAFGPWGAAIGGALGGVADIAGSGGGPFMGGSATAAAYGTSLDGSGWIVNLGGTQVASSSPTRTTTDPGAAAPIMQAGLSPVVMLLLAGAAVVWFIKHRKGRS